MYSNQIQKTLKTNKIGVGDEIIVKNKNQELKGLLMPKHEFGDPNSLVIKLDSGYNIGVDIKNFKIKKSKTKQVKEKLRTAKVEFDKDKPTISILHTGGTIASRVDYKTGGVVASFKPEEIIEMYPEIKNLANIKSKLLMNIFSEDMRFKHYQLIAKQIDKEIKNGADGIVITHGTDTLCYTACALAFMLENLPLPVILVGAQRSSDRGSSDAYLNLISAVRFIAETDFSGVAICMHENKNDENCLISPACKTRKLHSSTRDAFKPVNAKPVARIGEKIEFLSEYLKKDKNRKLNLKTRLEERVGILKIHPNMQPEEISCFKNYKGLVIEGTGLGHAPVSNGNEEVFEALKKLSKTCVIVMTSQTIFGRVNMNVYSTGRKLQEIGIISGKDMLTETAFIKLAWLLGNYSQKETRKLVTKNLRGEISK